MSDEREILGYREAEYRRRCALAFKDDQGRTLENIPEGLVWRLVDALEEMLEHAERDGWDELGCSAGQAYRDHRALLDNLHIKESK